MLYQPNPEVMAMLRTISETVSLTLLSRGANYKEGMDHNLFFPQYRFVKHFKSTTPYLSINFPIFQQYLLPPKG